MKILLIAPRYLPIFNKNNEGAIEKLEQIYLNYNESTKDKFVVYSPKIAIDNFDNKNLRNTEFRIIDQFSAKYKIIKLLFAIKKRLNRSPNNENYIRAIAKDINNRNEQNSYDLIIFENGEQDIPVFKKLTETKTRIVLHLHNDYVNKDVKCSAKIIDCCDEIWAVSDFIANRIKAVKPTSVRTIPNTIDKRSTIFNAQTAQVLKDKYNPDNNIVFLYVGRLLETKGILQLIDAFNEVNKDRLNAKLLLIGKTETSAKGKKLLAKLEKAKKNNPNICLVGYVRPNELVQYQQIADCQIIPSVWNEAFGLVVLEAMAANLKIIANKIGGIPEIGRDKIIYTNPDNLIADLAYHMRRIDKRRLPDNYYFGILSEYSNETFCDNIYKAIHIHEKRKIDK